MTQKYLKAERFNSVDELEENHPLRTGFVSFVPKQPNLSNKPSSEIVPSTNSEAPSSTSPPLDEEERLDTEWNLRQRPQPNIPRYVKPKVTRDVLTVDAAIQRLRGSAEAAFAAEDRLVAGLKKEGLLCS